MGIPTPDVKAFVQAVVPLDPSEVAREAPKPGFRLGSATRLDGHPTSKLQLRLVEVDVFCFIMVCHNSVQV
jgi:hypothetical protein